MSLSQAKFSFIVEHCLQSQSYLKCQDDFRSAIPKSEVNSISSSSPFCETGSVSDRKTSGRATVLNDVSVGNFRLSFVQSARKFKLWYIKFKYIDISVNF
jgi:hypothetical protein